MERYKVRSISLPPALDAAMEAEAGRLGMSISAMVQTALREYLSTSAEAATLKSVLQQIADINAKLDESRRTVPFSPALFTSRRLNRDT